MSQLVIEEDYSDFDWDSTEGDQPQFPPVPEGWYPVKIAKAEVKTVQGREGTFQKLTLRMQVLEGNPYAGRLIFDDIILNSKEGSRRRRAIIWRRPLGPRVRRRGQGRRLPEARWHAGHEERGHVRRVQASR